MNAVCVCFFECPKFALIPETKNPSKYSGFCQFYAPCTPTVIVQANKNCANLFSLLFVSDASNADQSIILTYELSRRHVSRGKSFSDTTSVVSVDIIYRVAQK